MRRRRPDLGTAMTPIHELLNRIRWDKEFGRGRFEIGYYDRHEDAVQRVAFREVVFPEGERHTFEVMDESGILRSIPFHRVREVIKDGQIIWQRPA
jgi:uncharacterized protein (UPF0248 family)